MATFSQKGLDALASTSTPAASSLLAEPIIGHFPTDMDVDADDSLALLDQQDTPSEKVDADFFNGARPPAPLPPRRRRCRHTDPGAQPKSSRTHPPPPSPAPQTLTTTLTTKTWSELRRQRLLPGTKVPGVRTRELFRSSGDGTRCSTPREVPAP